jgi:hypothetical protein
MPEFFVLDPMHSRPALATPVPVGPPENGAVAIVALHLDMADEQPESDLVLMLVQVARSVQAEAVDDPGAALQLLHDAARSTARYCSAIVAVPGTAGLTVARSGLCSLDVHGAEGWSRLLAPEVHGPGDGRILTNALGTGAWRVPDAVEIARPHGDVYLVGAGVPPADPASAVVAGSTLGLGSVQRGGVVGLFRGE